jgi:putative membrane protein
MKKYVTASLCAAVIFWSCDKNDDNNNNNTDINNTDRNFTLQASMSNFAEVDAGQAAASKGSTAVAAFGQMMVTDHTMAQAMLDSIASSYTLAAPDSLDAEHAALKTQLAALTGRSFDSVYIHSQVNDHQKAIDLFNDEVSNGHNYQLTNYASSLLPKLQMHLQMADSVSTGF